MKRKLIDQLIAWKTEYNGKSILLSGVKGVGKTYLAYDFAKAFFENIYYLNFERNPLNKNIFQTKQPEQISRKVLDYFRRPEEKPPENSILILDEISYCSEALTAIKENRLRAVFPYIISISSRPLPKKYENCFTIEIVHPLEFDEFLWATGNDWYIEAIKTHYMLNTNIPDIVHKELLSLHELYMELGGMPGIINEYLNLSAAFNVAEHHEFLLGSYREYIIRNNPDGDALKMKQVLDSLTGQLMKSNRKFQYKIIRKGTTYTMFQEAIRRLVEQKYVIRCSRITEEQLKNPSGYIQNDSEQEKNTGFKLYFPDTGMLNSRMIEKAGIAGAIEWKKALLENYIAQAFDAKNYRFAFWESDSIAKIDFLIAKNDEWLPIEIYENEKTRSKSISILKQKCKVSTSIKISSRNFELINEIKYVPYYAVFCI